MNTLDKQYLDLLQDILTNGNVKGDRTGTGTKSVFGRVIRHNMKEGFPLLTSKKMFTKGIIIELIWFLNGDTNIKFLVDNGVNIWNGDAYKKYVSTFDSPDDALDLEGFIEKIKSSDVFAKKWGELGPVYGAQWRKWQVINGEEVFYIDQIKDLIRDLKNNPDSRRLMVSAWNVADVPNCVLPPCHYGFQCYTRELDSQERYHLWRTQDSDNSTWEDLKEVPTRELSLSWNQRSVDTFLGLPFNIASYGFLLEVLAQQSNMVAGELIGYLGDTHLYSNHLTEAVQQLNAETFELPKLVLNKSEAFDKYVLEDFTIENYKSSKTIKAKLNN